LAVVFMVIVTGAGPQLKVITPPAATAATTAADVQLAGVPLPTTRSGRLVSTACAAGGTVASPSGLPGLGRACGRFDADGLGVGDKRGVGGGETDADTEADGEADTGAGDDVDTEAGAEATGVGPSDADGRVVASSPQPDRATAQITVTVRAGKAGERTAQMLGAGGQRQQVAGYCIGGCLVEVMASTMPQQPGAAPTPVPGRSTPRVC
jgi:hypothetical protein